MKIFYLTSSIEEDAFNQITKGGVSLNPAGQNFHFKLIDYLSKYNEVSICSLPPLYLPLKSKNGYHYFLFKSKLEKKLFSVSNLVKSIKESIKRDDVILFDSTSFYLSKVASRFSKDGYKTIAILTDNPFNITYQSKHISRSIIKNTSSSFASISLTKELTSLFKLDEKPSMQILGITEKNKPVISKTNNYIYFSGALFEKYGVKELLDDYLKAKPSLDLIIAGHGDMDNQIKEYSKNNPKIKYLGLISKEDNYAYEANTSLAINPRPYPSVYDLYSVPSKLIEYLCLSRFVASRYCTPLSSYFTTSINLIDGSIYDFFISHIDKEGNLINLKENDFSKNKKDFDGDSIAKQIISFLKSLN